MRKSRFTEAQIIGMIKEQEPGGYCRRYCPACLNAGRRSCGWWDWQFAQNRSAAGSIYL